MKWHLHSLKNQKNVEFVGVKRLLPLVVVGCGFTWACARSHRSDLEDAPVRPISSKSSELSKHLRSEFKSAEDAKLFASLLPSMGRLVQPVTPENADAPREIVCTAFHIGDGFVLTSGSCVKECATLKVTWIKPNTASAEGGTETSCSEVVSRSDTDENDFAVLKMKEPQKIPTYFVRLSLNTTVAGKSEVVLLGFADGTNKNVWLSSGCALNAGTGYEGAVEGIDSHDCTVEQGSQGALLFSKTARAPLALFSKRLDGINVVTAFKKIIVPDPTPEPIPAESPAATPTP